MAGFKLPKWAATPARIRRNAKLEVVKDGQVMETIRIGEKACYLLGRNEDVCDYGLQHPSISRQHAVIAHNKEGEVVVMDLGSAQGTFVNQVEIDAEKPHLLKEGDVIAFGASTRTYIVRSLTHHEETRDHNLDDKGEIEVSDLPTSFGGVKRPDSRLVENDQAVDSSVVSTRKQREAEIAAMTATMLMEPVHKSSPQSQVNSKVHEHPVDTCTPKHSVAQDEESEGSDDDDNESAAKDDVASRYNIPMSHEVHLSAHHKMITSIAIDPPGGRVATGSMDYHVKLWDFAGMARHIRPFREVEVEEGHPIVALSYSPSGDKILAATGSSQPKILSREGVEEIQFAKGDMYVVEMANTNGHTHTVTGAAWHPQRREQMISSSLDGTVRIWDVNGKQVFEKLVNFSVLKAKSKKGKRCAVTTCRYNGDGSLIVCGTMDGQVISYDPRKAYKGPALSIRDAHAEGGGDLGISCVRYSPDGRYIGSRACSDDTVKLWDIRKVTKPIKVFKELEGVFASCNFVFNSTGTSIAAGTCVRKGKQQFGQVHFFDVHTPGIVLPIASVPMHKDESAICVEWHHTLNQIFVGSSNNTCRILYNPQLSTKGVLLTATKKLKVQNIDFGVSVDESSEIYNPHALPMYRDDLSKKRKRSSINKPAPTAAAKARIPEKPLTGPGVGGRISGSSTFTQYFMSQHIKGNSIREEDPREAILKYAKKAEEDPQFASRAYASSQPSGKIDARYALASRTLEEEKIAMEEQDKKLLQP